MGKMTKVKAKQSPKKSRVESVPHTEVKKTGRGRRKAAATMAQHSASSDDELDEIATDTLSLTLKIPARVVWDKYPERTERLLDYLLRPLSYLGAARPLMLPLFRLLPYLYLPDRSTAYTGLTSAVAAISMLSSYRPNTSTSVRTMLTFLFRLTFPRLSNHSLTSCYESSPV
jgi:hypothetical protein